MFRGEVKNLIMYRMNNLFHKRIKKLIKCYSIYIKRDMNNFQIWATRHKYLNSLRHIKINSSLITSQNFLSLILNTCRINKSAKWSVLNPNVHYPSTNSFTVLNGTRRDDM